MFNTMTTSNLAEKFNLPAIRVSGAHCAKIAGRVQRRRAAFNNAPTRRVVGNRLITIAVLSTRRR
jgi:hypothetical protein